MQQFDMYTATIIRHQQAALQTRLIRQRLVREALANRQVRFYQPALVSLGKRMVIWGTQLQRRYTDLSLAPEASEIKLELIAQHK